MDGSLTLASAGFGLALTGVGLLMVRPPEPTSSVSVGFPPDLEAEQVETMLGTVAGLPARSRVTMDAEGADGGLAFFVRSSISELATLRSGLQGVAPGVRLGEPETDVSTDVEAPSLRARISWRGTHVLLRRDQRELAVAGLLGVLRGAGRDERMRLSIRLRPVVRPKAPKRQQGRERDLLTRVFSPQVPLPADQLRLVRAQYSGPLLNVRIEVLIWAHSQARARQLLQQVVAVLRARSGLRGRFQVRSHRFALSGAGTLLAPAEIVGLLGWPLDGPDVPGLRYVRSPLLLPDAVIPHRRGRLFGVSTWPGMERRELRQPVVGAQSHAILIGPTGSGKSTLLTGLFLNDVASGRGAVLVDMKGDTANDVLARIPDCLVDRVVVLDPSDGRPLPGLKGLGSDAPDLTADLWVGLFRNLFADSWGVRTERYLRLGIQTLALSGDAVITDLSRVFADVSFRRRLLSRSAEPLLMAQWASFDALSPSQQSEHLTAPLGKSEDVLGRRTVRAVLGQARPRMTIAQAFRQRKIVVVRCPPGLLGEATAQLLGGLTVYEIFQATMAREGIAPEKRVPYSVYIDEPAVMRLIPIPLDSLFELARGLGVGVTLATQSVTQLPQAVQSAILTNVATIAAFRENRKDALLIAGELLGVSADQLQHLGQYEIALRLGIGHGKIAPVATARTLPLPEPCSDPQAIRDRSASQYGISLKQTDEELRRRWQRSTPGTSNTADVDDDQPIGRRRRPS